MNRQREDGRSRGPAAIGKIVDRQNEPVEKATILFGRQTASNATLLNDTWALVLTG